MKSCFLPTVATYSAVVQIGERSIMHTTYENSLSYLKLHGACSLYVMLLWTPSLFLCEFLFIRRSQIDRVI